MPYIYSAKRTIDRVRNEQDPELARIRRDVIRSPKIVKILDDLDGQPATASCWRRQVHGEPVMYVVGRSGEGRYVHEDDCEWRPEHAD